MKEQRTIIIKNALRIAKNAGIQKAIAIVVSESTGRVSIFEKGRIISTLEPLISGRLE